MNKSANELMDNSGEFVMGSWCSVLVASWGRGSTWVLMKICTDGLTDQSTNFLTSQQISQNWKLKTAEKLTATILFCLFAFPAGRNKWERKKKNDIKQTNKWEEPNNWALAGKRGQKACHHSWAMEDHLSKWTKCNYGSFIWKYVKRKHV